MVTRTQWVSLALAAVWAMTSTAAPAAIMDPTPAGRADIEQAVAAALGAEVLIADDALTTSSLLTIERRMPRTMEGRVATGRVLEPPEVFQLVLDDVDDDRCVLVHRRTGDAYPLKNARCHPSPAKAENAPLSDQDR